MRVKWLLNLFLGLLVPFLLITCGEGLTDDNSSMIRPSTVPILPTPSVAPLTRMTMTTAIRKIMNGTAVTLSRLPLTAPQLRRTLPARRRWRHSDDHRGRNVCPYRYAFQWPIVINAGDDDLVRLILNGVNITNSSNAPIYIANADKAIIVLAESTTNYITDGTSYSSGSEANAPIYSLGDLSFYGDGALIVDGNYEDGIVSKDGLVVKAVILPLQRSMMESAQRLLRYERRQRQYNLRR
jgi:hypothetical protein